MASPKPRPAIESLVSYQPAFGKPPAGRPIRLSANEGALGCSPHVAEALKNTDLQLSRYPEPQDYHLITDIAERYQLEAERILLSNGSDELIYLLCQAYLDPGDEAIHTQYGFLVFSQSISVAGATPVVAPDDGMTVSVDAILAAVTERTKMVFLANPNNPTGTMIDEAEVRRLQAGLPEGVLLVLDLAYSEFMGNAMDYAADMVENSENTVMLRTFSKLHGLASVRLGWGYFPPEILAVLRSIRGPFSVNQIAVLAGRAAIADRDFQQRSSDHNNRWIPEVTSRLAELGLTVHPTVANFFLVQFDGHNGPRADQALEFFRQQGILLRDMIPYGLPDCLRMSIGTDTEMEQVIACFADLMSDSGPGASGR